MSTDSNIMGLSMFINSQVGAIDEYLRAQNLPGPSLGVEAAPVLVLPPHLMEAQSKALAALDDLKCLLQGPKENLSQLCNPRMNVMPALQTCLRYQVASHIGIGEELTYQELSTRCQLDEPTLRRIMRMLISMRVFDEPRKNVVAHNGSSRLMHKDQRHIDFLTYATEVIWSSGFTTTDALQEWPDAQEPDQTAYFKLSGKTFWDDVKGDKDKTQRFTSAMAVVQDNPQFGTFHLLNDLEWNSDNCPALMVDVGGHAGAVSTDILRKYPTVKSIVQDVPEIVAISSIPEDVKGRLEFQAHDFFTPQPAIGADVYFLRMILHDWPDKYARMIISNLIPALKPGTRIVLNETCMGDPGAVPKYYESMLRGFDLCMKQFFNSKERDLEEWIHLFQSCDERFKFTRIKMSPGSGFAVIEFVWEG